MAEGPSPVGDHGRSSAKGRSPTMMVSSSRRGWTAQAASSTRSNSARRTAGRASRARAAVASASAKSTASGSVRIEPVELPADSPVRVELDLAPGTYRYYCDIAGHENMQGTLVVQ